MPSVSALIAAHRRGDRASLVALGRALAAAVADTPPLPTDPVALAEVVDTQGASLAGTWQEVRAARDFGDLSPSEYEYLSAAVDALTQEDRA